MLICTVLNIVAVNTSIHNHKLIETIIYSRTLILPARPHLWRIPHPSRSPAAATSPNRLIAA